MNKFIFRHIAMALCAVGLMAACSDSESTPTPPQKEVADYTIILYGTGGGDADRNSELDLALRKNLTEVRNTEYTPRVNFTAMVRYSVAVAHMEGTGVTQYDWLPSSLTATGGMLLEQNNVRPYEFFMTAPENITQFIDQAVEAYPARKYIFIAWNHGGGFEPEDFYYDPSLTKSTRTCMSDHGVYIEELDTMVDEHLTIFELEEALRNSNLVKSGQQFEAVYTDMCLMGGVEVACQLAPYTRYFMGAAHNTPAQGGNYHSLITSLRDCGLDTEKAMKQFIPQTVEHWRSSIEGRGYTRELFCYNTQGVLQAAQAFAPIAQRMAAHYASLPTTERLAWMSDLRSKVYRYEGASPFYDWAHMVRQAQYEGKDPAMEQIFEQTLTRARVEQHEICCSPNKLPQDMKCGLSIVMCGPTAYRQCPTFEGEPFTVYSYHHNYPHTRFDQAAHWSTMLATGVPEDEDFATHFDLNELGVAGTADFDVSFSGDCCIELAGNFVFDNPASAEKYARLFETDGEGVECKIDGNKLKVYFFDLISFKSRYEISQIIRDILKRFEPQ